MSQSQPSGQGGSSAGRRRRPRYPGKYPRQFQHRYKERQGQKYPEILEHIRSQGRTPAGTHVPVLLKEVLACLDPQPGQVVADCTLGYGGHAAAFMQRVGSGGKLVGFEVDGRELEKTRRRLEALAVPISLHRMNFAGIASAMAREGLEGFDIVFADLGVSSMQVDDPARGISYKHEHALLDMRMDDRLQRTGADLVNGLSEPQLSAALWELADEPDHQRIAHFIVQRRQVAPIATTSQLTEVVFNAKGTTPKAWRKQADFKDLHPAARTFQAIRILVNDELGSLRELLRVAPSCLKPGGRIGIISFHSGEDRLVKSAFRDGKEAGVYSAVCEHVIRPSGKEVYNNPRSASAKFRWAVRA